MQKSLFQAFHPSGYKTVGLTTALTLLISCQPNSIEQVPRSDQNPAQNSAQNQAAEASPSVPMPPPPPAGAYLAQVSPEVFAPLQEFPLLGPAYIPAGFVLADSPSRYPESYALVYRSLSGQCFAIEYLAPGLAAADREIDTTLVSNQSFDSPLFGAGRKLYYSAIAEPSKGIAQPTVGPSPGGPAPTATPEPAPVSPEGTLQSEWLTIAQGHYRLIGAATITQNYPAQSPCTNVSLSEAVKIVTSLTDLKAPVNQSIGE